MVSRKSFSIFDNLFGTVFGDFGSALREFGSPWTFGQLSHALGRAEFSRDDGKLRHNRSKRTILGPELFQKILPWAPLGSSPWETF